MRCRDATASSFIAKVRGEIFERFHAFVIKRQSSCRVDCLARQDEFFVNNPLYVKGNGERPLHFALLLSGLP
jgi:hypothetical protein